LASARAVTRCQVRELTPNVVSIDFQRRNLLADPVACLDLAALADVEGTSVDLRRVFSGRTEYGHDWHVPMVGGHTLVAGSTGAGKNSAMWCPLVSIAPAIRDGLVRVSGIDPKGMELAYGRRIFHRYAVTGTDALTVLDNLVAAMNARKTQFAGHLQSVPISPTSPCSERCSAMRSTVSGTCSDRMTSPTHDHHVRSGPVPTRVDPRVLAAPRVGLEPTTLRLTDACMSLIGPRYMGMRRAPGGVQVCHGAARCGHNCGHAVASWRPA
jgi:hypothetical protein